MNRVKVKNATAVTGMLFIKPYDFLSNVMSVIHVLGTLKFKSIEQSYNKSLYL